MTTRCKVCFRPEPTEELQQHEGGCKCAACLSHCWGDYWQCSAAARTSRARALAAEETAAKLTNLRDLVRAHLAAYDASPTERDRDAYLIRCNQTRAAMRAAVEEP